MHKGNSAVKWVVAFLREAVVSAWNSRVGSVLTVVMVAGMCATVLLTSGRTVGAQDAVLQSIDSVGTRSIVIRADEDAGLTSSFLDRISGIEGISSSVAFGPAGDVRNLAIPGGAKVSSRSAYGESLAMLGIASMTPGQAWASHGALDALGMPVPAGAVVSDSTLDTHAIVGEFKSTQYLNFMNPIVVVPETIGDRIEVPLAIVVVVAASPSLVTGVKAATQSLLDVQDPSKVRMETSQELADLRALVQEQLGLLGHSLVLGVLALTSLLIAAILFGMVMLRRRDFGRRRALGATRTLIVALVLTQTFCTSLLGALSGSAIGTTVLRASNDPIPGFSYILSVATLGVVVGLGASVLPAVLASRRDPIKELRVP